MNYKYRIYHDYDVAKKNSLFLFNESQETFEYSHFDGTLVHCFLEPLIEVSCEKSTSGTGIEVTLRTDLSERQVEAALNHLLAKQNVSIPGLCLVGIKL